MRIRGGNEQGQAMDLTVRKQRSEINNDREGAGPKRIVTPRLNVHNISHIHQGEPIYHQRYQEAQAESMGICVVSKSKPFSFKISFAEPKWGCVRVLVFGFWSPSIRPVARMDCGIIAVEWRERGDELHVYLNGGFWKKLTATDRFWRRSRMQGLGLWEILLGPED
ncbi:hypothetical protein B0H17DRAFT_1152768 [Mycena rosella]|uniref:Uncharacterized protein n=1 Tax=Mycena rosella TaxID=1033263 RepID=A0AAD7BAW5_MYCRO|nr:hypothetical protein B0H17DRAFT_1152768 [Mycena rosella]